MTAKGKITTANLVNGETRVLVVWSKDIDGNDVLRPASKQAGAIVARVYEVKAGTRQSSYEQRVPRDVVTSEGTVRAQGHETFILAPETKPAVKLAEAAAYAEAEERTADAEAALRDQEAAMETTSAVEKPAATATTIAKHEPAVKIEDTQAIVGTMEGHRGIMFVFEMKGGKPSRRVTFDFYGAGAKFNGATYARLESAALGAMGKAHLLAQVHTFTHFLIR